MNAQVSFLEGELSLIHIPLELYASFVLPILQVLLPQEHSLRRDEATGAPPGLTADNKHSFLNVSITPVECSVVCHTYWAEAVFAPVLRSRLPPDAAAAVSISQDSYSALCVMSGGMDAGSRVVDLSSPLALAGIPIFFVTTYYSDFILVPTKDRQSVVHALLARGFAFSESDSSYVSPGSVSHPRGGGGGGGSSGGGSATPASPAQLQDRTFDLLRTRHVVPRIVPGLHLAHCSGRGPTGTTQSEYYHAARRDGREARGSRSGAEAIGPPTWVDNIDASLYTCLVSALALPPVFLSVTLTAGDPPSLLLDKALLPVFGTAVVGDVGGDLVPIFLDLVHLPFEATGIVSGVAGKLVDEMRSAEVPELSYLSTSKASAVILASEHAPKALEILRPLMEEP